MLTRLFGGQCTKVVITVLVLIRLFRGQYNKEVIIALVLTRLYSGQCTKEVITVFVLTLLYRDQFTNLVSIASLFHQLDVSLLPGHHQRTTAGTPARGTGACLCSKYCLCGVTLRMRLIVSYLLF